MSPEETEQTILEGLRAYGIEPKIYYTTPEDTGGGLAKRAAEEHAELVIAVGGDGTIQAVAHGLIGTQSILGIIPTGTMNNLAYSLNIPETLPAACTTIATGETRAVDVGKINDHYFLEVAGIGLEAAMFPLVEEIKHRNVLSIIHGVFNGLKTLFNFKPTRLRISIDKHRRRPYHALEVTICNTPFYGAHMQVAPEALMDDGLLDVVIYRNLSKFEYVRHAISISQGRRPYQPKIKYVRVQSLSINAEQQMAFHADGEVLGTTPARVAVLPGALRIRVSGKAAPGLHEDAQKELEGSEREIPASIRSSPSQ